MEKHPPPQIRHSAEHMILKRGMALKHKTIPTEAFESNRLIRGGGSCWTENMGRERIFKIPIIGFH